MPLESAGSVRTRFMAIHRLAPISLACTHGARLEPLFLRAVSHLPIAALRVAARGQLKSAPALDRVLRNRYLQQAPGAFPRCARDNGGMARTITDDERATAQELLKRARSAVLAVADYDQVTVDRLCQAIAGATANEETFGRLTRMSVEESGMGSAEGVPARRWKILGILRDALRTKSVGIIEELPEKGIVKYAKPAGVIAGLLPVTNPLVTMVNMAINAIKCKDAVIFSPHPLSRKTALEIA